MRRPRYIFTFTLLSLLCAARAMAAWELGQDLKVEESLDITKWMFIQELKDPTAIQRAQQEFYGKVISCVGECLGFSGTHPLQLRYLSRIFEGDEIHTGKNSYLWLALWDGTLVRLAPQTSMAFLETNRGAKKVFFHARLNHGHMYWLPRSRHKFKITNSRETDTLFLPVMEMTANLSWFQRGLFQKANEHSKALMLMSPVLLGAQEQYTELNGLIEKNNSRALDHEYLITSPNGTLHSTHPVSWFYQTGRNSYLKLLDRAETEYMDPAPVKGELYLRGYIPKPPHLIEDHQWLKIEERGREVSVDNSLPGLALSEVTFKRIPTILLVREKWLDHEDDGGHFPWGAKYEDRIKFLISDTVRIETTNVSALQKINPPLAVENFDEYYSRALESYYRSLKDEQSWNTRSVLDMSDLHYYGWILKNAGQQ